MSEPARVTARKIITRKGADLPHRDDSELQSAIVIYLIAERPEGASIGEISALTLGGRRPTEEVERVSAAVSRLEQGGEVKMDGKLVVPVLHSADAIEGEGGGSGS